MPARENKTKPETTSVDAFIAAVESPEKRADSYVLIDLMRRLTGEDPVMWGTSIIGFGKIHYRYESGHEGDMGLAGFSPRKAEFSIYLVGGYMGEAGKRRVALLEKLGKHRMGKACLYVKKLADIDMDVLEQLIVNSIDDAKARYPQ